MEFYPIQLGVNPGAWRLFALRAVDPKFNSFKERVFERDHHTCRFCGFQAFQYQQVINLDGNYKNNQLSNMVTACPFCAQCHFLEMVGKASYGGGRIVYLPEMSQTELNGLCHVAFCAISSNTDYLLDAQSMLSSIKHRSHVVDDNLGDGMSNPAFLGQMLIDTPMENQDHVVNELLKDLRLLPSRSKFNQQIEAWAQAALEEMN